MSSSPDRFVNFPWLPVDEYDFREVPKNECRFVCFWEYFRSIRTIYANVPAQVINWIMGKDGKGGIGAGLKTGRYICSRADDLALPYLTIDKLVFKPISIDDFANAGAFLNKLRQSGDPVSKYLWEQLRESTRQRIAANSGANKPDPKTITDLVDDVRKVLRSDKFFAEERFKHVPLSVQTRESFAKHSREELEWLYPTLSKELQLHNRWLLEETYPNEIKRNRTIRPLEWRSYDTYTNRATVMVPMSYIKQRMKEMIRDGDEPEDVIDRWLRDNDYRFSGSFSRGGTQKMIEETKEWIVKEAKKHPRPRRGKGASAPYEELKWLAAFRLDKVRKEHRMSVLQMMDKLDQYEREGAIHWPTRTLPLYQTEAGWSNAKGDAMRLLDLLESDPPAFEKRILF